ncbi:MAG: PorT family protein [Treponema sp.]|jgi:hypothetical protein|nr:PorT family protein [Treponema sp.]
MTGKRGFFPGKAGFRAALAFGVLGLLSVPVFAQNAEPRWGFDDEGRAIVAVLSLAGDETEMIRRFQEGTMEAVAALKKYSPREAPAPAGTRIPTDMPPIPSLAAGAHYALTGGVYPGETAGEYYLQLWLWDMTGSTMIYTDDLVYDEMEGALESLPGLVEWLFSHIRERAAEEPPAALWPDPLFMLGFRIGVSPRWYIQPGEITPGASAVNIEGGVSGALRINRLFSVQLEILLTGDTVVYRGLDGSGFLENEEFSSLTMTIPLLAKMNFRAGRFRISPLAGFYVMFPLGETRYRYHYSTGSGDKSYSWSYSVPLGFTAGIEGATHYGPGRIFAGLRYAGDFGNAGIDDDSGSHHTDYGHKRHALSLYLGYEFGFFEGKKLGTR